VTIAPTATPSKNIGAGSGSGGGGGGGGSMIVTVIIVVAVVVCVGGAYGLYRRRQAKGAGSRYNIVHANVAYDEKPKASVNDFGEEAPDDDDDMLISVSTDA
jgi:hypothetical protein